MTRISLVNTEAIQQIQQRTEAAGVPGGNTGRLIPGEFVRAVVQRDLGQGLYSIALRGNEIVTASSATLTPGQLLTLQVTGNNSDGRPTLQVVSLADPTVAGTQQRPEVTQLANNQLPDLLNRNAATEIARSLPNLTSGAAVTQRINGELTLLLDQSPPPATAPGSIGAEQQTFYRADGPVARLLAERPDLAPRLEQLYNQFQTRDRGLGSSIGQLVNQLGRLSTVGTSQQQGNIVLSQGALANQLLSATLLDDPTQLAQTLTDRIPSLSRGLEANVTQTLAEIDSATSPTPELIASREALTNTTNNIPSAAQQNLAATADYLVNQANSIRDRDVIKGTVDAIRSQLTSLRGQLQSLAANPQLDTTNVNEALARVDVVRNLLDIKAQLQDINNNQTEPSAVVQQTLTRVALARQNLESQIANLNQTNQVANAGFGSTASVSQDQAAAARQQQTGLGQINATQTAAGNIPGQAGVPANEAAAAAAAAQERITDLANTRETARTGAQTPEQLAQAEQEANRLAATRDVFNNDLKAQLLSVRAQLQGLPNHPPEAATVRENAIVLTNQLLDQVAAQQVRNIDTTYHYQFVELPFDARSGVNDARLHVFYRDQSRARQQSENDPFTIAMLLNMSQLGDVSAVMTAVGPQLTVHFNVKNPEAEAILREEAGELHAALAKAGHAGSSISVRTVTPSDAEGAAADKGTGQPDTPDDDLLWNLFLAAVPHDTDPGHQLNLEA